MVKALERVSICKLCGMRIVKRQNNPAQVPKYCDECKVRGGRCGTCGTPVSVRRKFCGKKCVESNEVSVTGHKKRGQKMMGAANPAKSTETRKKISDGVKASYDKNPGLAASRHSIWKQGKRYNIPDGVGNMLRSQLELRVAKELQLNGVRYVYEKPLPMGNGRFVYPDFTVGDEQAEVLVEVTGSAFEEWRESFKEKMRKISAKYPDLPVVVITYGNVETLSSLVELKKEFHIDVFAIDSPKEALVWDRVEDVTNLDYCHFIPWHNGKCSAYHAHASKVVSVGVQGYVNKITGQSWVVDFGILKPALKEAVGLLDHKTLVNRKYVVEEKDGLVKVVYDGICGHHELLLPVKEVCLLDEDSTSENLCELVAKLVLDRMPATVRAVSVRFYEGMNNSSEMEVGRETWDGIEKLSRVIRYHRRIGATDVLRGEWVSTEVGVGAERYVQV